MTTAHHPLDSVALTAIELGFGHCHIVGNDGEVAKNSEVDKTDAFDIVRNWEHVNLVFVVVPASEDAVAWLYLRTDEQGESLSEAVQFVSLKPDLIRSRQAVH